MNKVLLSILGVLVVSVGLMTTVYLSQQTQLTQQFAWSVTESAIAECNGDGDVVITVHFTNTESVGSQNAMKVTAQDIPSGQSVDLGIVLPGQTISKQIDTEKTTIDTGVVVFNLSWADGRSGTDTRSASYSTLACHTPSPSPEQSPTPIPTATATPTPSGKPSPTVCLTPGAIKNVKVACPNCSSQ